MKRRPYLESWQRDPFYLNRFPKVNGRYAPVKGGRWSIRRMDIGHGLYWYAWCRGQAGRYTEKFYSWEEAMWWASQVALAFRQNDTSRKAELMALKRAESVVLVD